MNTNLQILNQTLSMSSREIAELTGKRHADVLRDVRNMLTSLNIESTQFCAEYIDATGRSMPCFNLPKRETLILVSGYNIQMRAIIIDRWQELEVMATINTPVVPLLPFTPHEIAVKQFEGECKIAALLNCPKHLAQQEIVKSVRKTTGFDFEFLLKISEDQQNILPHEVMLEPTEIGVHFNLGSGIKVNKILEGFGLQTYTNKQWTPTSSGEPHCQKHAWTKQNKSGYNLKWNLKYLESLFNSTPEEIEESEE